MSSENIFVLSNGESIPVIIENRRGARNVTLRPKTSPNMEIHISKPWTTSTKFVLNFLESKRKWVEKILDSVPKKEKITPNIIISILYAIIEILIIIFIIMYHVAKIYIPPPQKYPYIYPLVNAVASFGYFCFIFLIANIK